MKIIHGKDKYKSNLRDVVDWMREQMEESGHRFEPSFEKCIEIVRKNHVRAGGAIMPTDETAYYVLLGALEDLHGPDWVNERFGAPAAT